MKSSSIKTQFTKHIKETMGSENPRYSLQFCGITNDEARRKAEHKYKFGEIANLKCIDAENLKEANLIEVYFSEKGTQNLP